MHMCCCRCALHGFNLLLKSVMAAPWARDLVVSCQLLVTYFRASHKPLALLRQAAQQFSITRELQSANKTRFTSKHTCTSSVEANQPALNLVSLQHADCITNQDVLAVLEDPGFFSRLQRLNKLLAPLTNVVMAVQRNTTTLADVCR